MPSVTLGFAEPASPWTLVSHLFPDKIGGRPAWLALKHLPNPIDLGCPCCRNPMAFLLQLYSPIDTKPDCFHRMLFVFMCKSGACFTRNAVATPFRVFRSQLPRDNPYYSPDPPKEEEETNMTLEETVQAFREAKLPSACQYSSLCPVCGCLGDKKCGVCNKAVYCSKLHQAIHWKASHKRSCTQQQPHSAFDDLFTENSFLLTEYTLSSEEFEEPVNTTNESEDDDDNDDEVVGDGPSSSNNAEFEALEEIARKETKEERQFNKFKTIMKREPDQVVRFNRGKSPVWVSLDRINVPDCSACGGRRVFEFQITPQILSYLSLDRVGEACPDFATVYIFTCEQSCSPQPFVEYVEEFVAFDRVP